MGTRIATFVVLVFFAGRSGAQSAAPVPVGVWGGKGVQLTVTAAGATVDYGCDTGVIDQRLQTDTVGKFVATGTHTFGSGGPREPGQPSRKPHKARYEGERTGDKLRLIIWLPDLNRKLGEFTVERGHRPILERCG